MLWMKSLAFAAQPLLDWFGRWHHAHVVASLRWPAWKSGPTPSVAWQPAHLALSTIWRRGGNPVATFETSGGGTTTPPMPLEPLAVGGGEPRCGPSRHRWVPRPARRCRRSRWRSACTETRADPAADSHRYRSG